MTKQNNNNTAMLVNTRAKVGKVSTSTTVVSDSLNKPIKTVKTELIRRIKETNKAGAETIALISQHPIKEVELLEQLEPIDLNLQDIKVKYSKICGLISSTISPKKVKLSNRDRVLRALEVSGLDKESIDKAVNEYDKNK